MTSIRLELMSCIIRALKSLLMYMKKSLTRLSMEEGEDMVMKAFSGDHIFQTYLDKFICTSLNRD